MADNLPAECLAIVTGIFPKKGPTRAELVRASKIHAKVEESLKRFLSGEKPKKWETWIRPPEQSDLWKDLTKPFDAEKLVSEDAPGDLVPLWIMVVGNARDYAKNKWPVFEADSLVPSAYDLSQDEYGDVWEIVRTLDDIDNFLGDFESYVLTREQVDSIQECFPSFYDSIRRIILDQLSAMAAKGVELDWKQEDMTRVIAGLKDEEPITIKSLGEPAKSKPLSEPQQSKQVQQMRPTMERIEANEARG
jgi:hypothetical protein